MFVNREKKLNEIIINFIKKKKKKEKGKGKKEKKIEIKNMNV